MMPDREKVIDIYANCILNDKQCCSDCYTGGPGLGIACRQQVLTDALSMLKEQQQQIWEFQDQVEYLTDKQKEQKFLVDSDGKITPLPVVVRCKDCKHGKIHGIDVECVAHEEAGYDPEPWHPLDWFCADGERQEGK